jgi:peptidoglycan/LPS O-acetylase OafA/YrhL
MGSYLLVPVLMALIIRRGAVLCFVTAVAALLAIDVVSRGGLGASGPLDVVSGDSLYPLLRAVAGFALGMVVFRFADVVDRWSMAAQDGAVVAILAGIAAAATLESDLPNYLLLIPLVAVLSRDGRLAQLLLGNVVVYRLGVISYSAYLIHPLFVSFAVRAWRLSGQIESAYFAASALCFAAIWLLSELSYRFIELPGRNWIVRLWRPQQQNAPARAGALE